MKDNNVFVTKLRNIETGTIIYSIKWMQDGKKETCLITFVFGIDRVKKDIIALFSGIYRANIHDELKIIFNQKEYIYIQSYLMVKSETVEIDNVDREIFRDAVKQLSE